MDDNKRRETNDQEDVILGSEQSEATPESIQDAGQASMTKEGQIGQELEQLKSLASQLENNYKRALADYQNLQRRTQEEKSDWIRMANREMILKILPVLDTLRLTQKHIQDKGLELTIGEFDKVLQEEGVVRILAEGKSFDPKTMEAVTTKEVDKKEKGIVIEEVRAGYMLGEYVLRVAQVIVGA